MLLSSDASSASNSAQANGAGSNWDDAGLDTLADQRAALAESIKLSAEKETSKQWKILDYERRVASSYQDFDWDDLYGIVSLKDTSFYRKIWPSRHVAC